MDAAEGVVDCLGDLYAFFSPGEAFGKPPNLGQALSQVGAREHGGEAQSKADMAQLPFE